MSVEFANREQQWDWAFRRFVNCENTERTHGNYFIWSSSYDFHVAPLLREQDALSIIVCDFYFLSLGRPTRWSV